MKITHTWQGITATIPSGDRVAKYAVEAYGFTLNTPSRRNIEHDGKQFAAAIEAVVLATEPRTSELLAHLRSI